MHFDPRFYQVQSTWGLYPRSDSPRSSQKGHQPNFMLSYNKDQEVLAIKDTLFFLS